MAEPRIWKPSSRQEEFLQIPDTVSEALYGGAAGGGKSEILLMTPIARKFYQAPRFKGILFRRTFPELEKSLILRSQSDGFYKGTSGEYNSQLRRWRWPSGAVMDFGYIEHEQDVRKYDTTEYNYAGFDEGTSFTEFQYLYFVKSRIRTSDTNLPAIARMGSNPGNIGHGWVRKRFVEPAPYGTLIRDKATRQLRIFIQSLVQDNPYLMEADPGYITRLEGLPEAEKRAKLYGDWWTFSGQVFDDWRIEPFSDEPDNARHVVPPFEIPPYWPVVLASDWGYSAMAWNGFFAAAPTRRAYLCEELTFKKTKISTWATEVGKAAQKYHLVDSVLDPSGWNNVGVEHTVAEQIMESSGINFRKADNDRLGGKMLMQEYLRWRPKPPKKIPAEGFSADFAQQLLRMKGMDAYNLYVDAFLPEPPETNLPKLQVFSNCEEFINTIPLCIYNADGSAKDKEDVAEFEGDDPYDGGRYGIKAVDRFFNTSVREAAKVAEVDAVIENLKKTGDQTVFHRQMEKIERKQRAARRPFRRFHGRLR